VLRCYDAVQHTRYRGDRSECAWLIKENKNRDKFEISALPLNNKVSNEFIIIIFVSRPAGYYRRDCLLWSILLIYFRVIKFNGPAELVTSEAAVSRFESRPLFKGRARGVK
jgi:hypothetical protein